MCGLDKYRRFGSGIVILIMMLFLPGLSASGQLATIQLHEGWRFKQARLTNWYPATVPGVVHADLIDNKIIEDPFFKLNERSVQWIDKEDWMYETSFNVDAKELSRQNIQLVFEGLDTYADVYLNGQKILEADNMFLRWSADIKTILKGKDNKLEVYFHSPVKKTMKLWEALPFQYRTSNDHSEIGGLFDRKLRVFTRKAGYHYGWDWGPRLLTCGIWRPVYIETWDNVRIENTHFIQKEVSQKKAVISTKIEINSVDNFKNVLIRISDAENGKLIASKKCDLSKGLNTIDLGFTIKNPVLWWSNGLGKAHLYQFKTTLTIGEQTMAETTDRIGIRSIRVVKESDQWGKSFYFELNGVPVFAKGANYIPADNLLTRVGPENYRKIIQNAVEANMNMLRVWGGGIYENDIFYDLCDENGLLVWQDFMFACSVYPAEGALLENMRQEAIYNVKRLRNHACLAIWCGNNENLDALVNWGWLDNYKKQNPAYAELIWKQYEDQYHKMLPEVIAEHNPQVFYLPSSPFTDYDGRVDITDGDIHYWEAWKKGLPISIFAEEKSRFFSEYGFQSFPDFETVKKYASDSADWNIYSDVMMWHQRGGMHANRIIEKCTLYEYGQPKNFVSGLYLSQLLQADAIKIAIESHRRDMPYCMGSLYWQLNDCWPVASWSGTDYYGRWKAMHYFVKKAFNPVLVSPVLKNDSLLVYIVSDKLKNVRAELNLKLLTLDGEMITTNTRMLDIPANSSKIYYTNQLSELLQGNDRSDVFIHVALTTDNETVENILFAEAQKYIHWKDSKLKVCISEIKNGFKVTVSSECLVRGVHLSITDDIDSRFSDNFFDVLPGRTVEISLNSYLDFNQIKNRIKVMSLNEALKID